MTPPSRPSVSLSLTVKKTADALDFYNRAFGATEDFRLPLPNGGIAHAEFTIGNTRIYISDESEDYHAFAMPEGSKASCLFSIMVEDCDAAFAQATEAGAEPLVEPQDQFWGTRSAVVLDPFGYRWSIIQPIENLTPEEITARAKELFSFGG